MEMQLAHSFEKSIRERDGKLETDAVFYSQVAGRFNRYFIEKCYNNMNIIILDWVFRWNSFFVIFRDNFPDVVNERSEIILYVSTRWL